MNPEAQLAARVEWQLFCTWTYSQDGLPHEVKAKALFAFLRETAALAGIHWKELLWMVRLEAGEMNGRLHHHGLLAGLPPRFVNIGNCFRLACIWDHEVDRKAPNYKGKKLRVGMARIRVFHTDLDGVGYVLKALPRGNTVPRGSLSKPTGADLYEYSKFSADTASVTLSESLILKLQVQQRDSR